MREFKGTPGPWFASTSDRSIGPISKDDDQSYGMIIPVAWAEFDGKPGHQQANSNLIAAAPELLEVLQSLLEIYDCQDGRQWTTSSKRRALDEAREAVNKGLGDSKHD